MNASNSAYFRPGWSPFTVLAMVLGFMVYWPVGLAVLAYILWGARFGFSGGQAGQWFNRQKAWAGFCQNAQQRGFERRNGWSSFGPSSGNSASGNAAFDAYREEQLKRLDEERRRLDEEVNEFHDYLRNLHMARDREEFDRFLRDRQGKAGSNPPPATDGQNGNTTSF